VKPEAEGVSVIFVSSSLRVISASTLGCFQLPGVSAAQPISSEQQNRILANEQS